MNKQECLDHVIQYQPTTVNELIDAATPSPDWLHQGVIFNRDEIKNLRTPRVKVPVCRITSNDEGPIRSPHRIFRLIKMFIKRERIFPRPCDLIEAGAARNTLHVSLKTLELRGCIERIKISNCHSIIRLVGENNA